MPTTDSINLINHRVAGSHIAYYIPNFVTAEEEAYLLRKIDESPQQQWKSLPNRRLQILGGGMSSKNVLVPQDFPSYVSRFPDLLARIRGTGAFQSSPHGAPNHIILNEYLPGHGIMPHEDGPSYHPVVATLSLGSHAVFHYYQYNTESGDPKSSSSTAIFSSSSSNGKSIDKTPILSMLLEPRSLVITTSALYISHLHGIDDVHEDHFGGDVMIANTRLLADSALKAVVIQGGVLKRETRYSLTCRDVEKVAARITLGRR